jgi:hypothetical protein
MISKALMNDKEFRENFNVLRPLIMRVRKRQRELDTSK